MFDLLLVYRFLWQMELLTAAISFYMGIRGIRSSRNPIADTKRSLNGKKAIVKLAICL